RNPEAGPCATERSPTRLRQRRAYLRRLMEVPMSTTSGAKLHSDGGQTVGGGPAGRFRPSGVDFANYKPQHFLWRLDGKVATVTLNRPDRKNPLTLESYAELRDTFRGLVYADGVKTV